ncbi:hypothetical protein DID88_004968 [Monilinia fructigena]|uniref:Uncharacterized protein n=1 Tax=Monilinia fructigena TaxID=38457 RepID=A0A395IQ47_9HELO|nr:hypothetical protein DID88_004968 [Monilinia fructigena]
MQSPSMGLVRDPMRLRVVFASERLENRKDPYGGGEDWLDQQYKEKRRCRLICMVVTFGVAILVAAAVVVVLYFTGRIAF